MKKNPTAFKACVQKYSDYYKRLTQKILDFPNTFFLPYNLITSDIIIKQALDVFLTERISPRDSFHLSYALCHGISGFITSDSDFDNLSLPHHNITIYKY
jgi:predicted nucleic acid-binding protein